MTIFIISDNNRLYSVLCQHTDEDIVLCKSIEKYEQNIENSIVILDEETAGKQLKNNNKYAGIITLSESNQANDASHVIKKPYHISQVLNLISRINRHEKIIPIGNYHFDYIQKKLTDSSLLNIELTEKEADIIKTLHDASPNSLEKKELLEIVWGYEQGIDTHTLETHIYRLRKKLGKNNDFITTEKDGYKILD